MNDMSPRGEISLLLDQVTPGHTLPQAFYVSPKVHSLDLDVFFRRHWIVAGVSADVPEPGDVRTMEIGDTSILILRGEDGVIRAFHNVCRHRGARLVQGETANVGRLVCPYHQWTYDLSGDLAHASKMGQDFDRACNSLRPVHLRNIGGMLMVCVAEDAPADIDDLQAEMLPRLWVHDLENAKIAYESVIIEQGNWKLVIDNNRECYHCAGSHPELCVALSDLDIGYDPEELTEEDWVAVRAHEARVAEYNAKWEAEGIRSGLAQQMSGRPTIFRTQRYPIAMAGESHTMDTRIASTRLLGAITDPKLGDLHYWTHNSWHHFFSDHAVVTYIVPLNERQTMVRSVWLVHKDAREGVDYDLNRLTEVWMATNREDADLVGITQAGVQTTGYVPGKLAPYVEALVAENNAWYVERLRAAGY